ncbi:MAG TPA: FHA domain-containing protein, partial [Kofleriaceae bacterium]
MVPKAPSFGDEEKTTIESDGETGDGDVGWEDEPSTTVEQGEVADRVARLGAMSRKPVTNVTDATGSMLDEPTVDDQRANQSIQMVAPAVTAQARLVVTAGNDRGRELIVAPGKSYTIGRGLDNDLVLTDIAVSRKHFDIRFEGSHWIVQDRGSGNGTLVNGNVEDAAFMLANSDVLEIGNTTFRIDIPNGLARASNNALPTVDVPLDDDEDEGSTINGAPIEEKPSRRVATKPGATPGPRPRTVPPPLGGPRMHSGPT